MRFFLLAISLTVLPAHAEAEDHWAYLPPVEPKVSAEAGAHPIDAILAAAWKKAGIQPAKQAPPRVWIERAAFTLTGLPATAEQIRRIEERPDDATWKSLVDELLESPAYGERWARHWMDVARYADTQGYNFDQDNRYPFAYTYRDWLIRSFNEDLPYGDFIKLQIAADLLTDRPDHPDLAALGFLTVGPRAGRLETIDDRVDVVTRGFLSSTVACARCHDHKSDPITTKDYYSLYSIFENTDEPGEKPVIGKPKDEAAFAAFNVELAKLEDADRAARQVIVDQIRTPESFGVYLELAWIAKKENWDVGKSTADAFKRGRFRPSAVVRWRDFLNEPAWSDKAVPRLATWAREMDAADEAGRKALCLALAQEWSAAPDGSELKALAARGDCPLSYDTARVSEIFDQEDGNQNRARAGAKTRLFTEHAGSPPRAMSLADRKNFSPAQVFVRGNPDNKGEAFDREWLSFLGGGKFPEGKSPRLSLAEKIADPANPLASRVMVNRVWAWHFGNPLADPGDFGVQQLDPALRPLMDWLALRFNEQGRSLKNLHRLILTSQAFRLAAEGPEANQSIDQANTLFWKWNRRREDFESMRDRLLATAGTLDRKGVGGRSISLENGSSDTKRSVYGFVDRYALSSTFISFDLPHPDHHSPKRVETTVPQQALYFLNGPLVLRQAAKLAADPEFHALGDDAAKLNWLFERIYQRAPTADESRDALEWLHHVNPADYQPRLSGVWEIRHAPDTGGLPGEAQAFPIFSDGTWKTGPDAATAPIRWLNAGAGGGHPAAGHDLILRWRALGAGEVRMTGTIKRTGKGGATLAWNLAKSGSSEFISHPLAPDSEAAIEGEWAGVAAGDTVDFVLRAPEGDTVGSVGWNLRVMGREKPDGKPVEVGNLKKQFPTTDAPPAMPGAADPWADLIQMLWASNEFHFID
ncbi:DUF1549 domain-containing protein [Luteolibacter yonseiensis]|uniref:DUF1549 domain-containing protein n=1 Tax=Luteolibacter yonseiensis TaxID=1144680 RepID=A0A934R293_9BACT|nr:DUF1549 and DUF1553 domain-containing protein [Luteolibacter yonseiensis]MBK1815472.1 DUF1549 domain-containing protein [Luteolibacter yonseiensis]